MDRLRDPTLLDSLVDSLPAARLVSSSITVPIQSGWGGRLLPPDPDRSTAARERDELLEALLGTTRPSAAQAALVERTRESSSRGDCAGPGEGGLAGERGAYRLIGRRISDNPATVRHLAARIDRLATEAKRLLRPPPSSARTCPCRCPGHADARSRGARRADISPGRGVPLRDPALPDLEYTFKHALTQRWRTGRCSTTGSAPCTPASRGHRAARSERVAEQAERLAHHALRGELGRKRRLSPPGWDPGHGRALTRGNAHLEQALVALRRSRTRETTELTIDLHIDLRNALSRSAIGAHGGPPPERRGCQTLATSTGSRGSHLHGDPGLGTGDYDELSDLGRSPGIARALGDRSSEVVATSPGRRTSPGRFATRPLCRANVALEGGNCVRALRSARHPVGALGAHSPTCSPSSADSTRLSGTPMPPCGS